MIGFKSVTHQGWHAKFYNNVPLEACPYPANSNVAKEWRFGWNKALKGEPWNEPRRKKRIVE